MSLPEPDQIWHLELVKVWQAAESESAWAFYADNNENPHWDDDYYLRARDSCLIKLEQAEFALQEVATSQDRQVPDRADYPAYQGLHWGIQHVLTHDPIHLDAFIKAHSSTTEPIDRPTDDLLAGRLAWAAIHQLNQALVIHQNNTPRSQIMVESDH